jgi:hypothetical protein
VYGSEVQVSTLCEPFDQVNYALIFSFLLYKCGAIVSFVRFGDCVNWQARMVWCGVWGHVVSMGVVVFNKMGGKSCMVEVNGHNVIRDKPLKVCAKEPFDCPHEFNSNELGKKGFKF